MVYEVSPSKLGIVLVGRTGAGKSAAGNTILGEEVFKSKFSARSVTQECEKKEGNVSGRPVAVIDTPGLFDTKRSADVVEQEIMKCIALSAPGPRAFLLVIQLGRMTEEVKETVEQLQEMFGEEAVKHTILLFTHGDELEDQTIEAFIEDSDEDFQQLVEKFGNRYHVFNNKNMSDRTQVTELLEKIDRMVAANENQIYKRKAVNDIVEDTTNEPGSGCHETSSRTDESTNLLEKYGAFQNSLENNTKTLHSNVPVTNNNQRNTTVTRVPGQRILSKMEIVLFGKTGAGKSASGNTILGREEFRSQVSPSAVTKACEKRTGRVAERDVTVIDTPGVCDPHLSEKEMKKQIAKCILLSAPGPHAILLVLQVGRFTEEEKKAVEAITKMFGEGANRYTIVLFTRADELGGQTIEDFVKKDKELQDLVEKCGGYHTFSNKNQRDSTQVTELLEKIEKMVAKNEGRRYTNKTYRQAEANIKEKQEEIINERMRETNQKIHEVEEEIEKLEKEKICSENYIRELKKKQTENSKSQLEKELKKVQEIRQSYEKEVELKENMTRNGDKERIALEEKTREAAVDYLCNKTPKTLWEIIKDILKKLFELLRQLFCKSNANEQHSETGMHMSLTKYAVS